MNVFSYIRVSSKGQLDGDGPERQRTAIQHFCQGNQLRHIFEFSEAITGTSDAADRPQFSELLFSIDAHNSGKYPANMKIDAVVVERMDRLARDLMVGEVLLGELRKRGVKVFATDQGALIDMASDGGDPTRVLIRQIMGALAQWEKSQLVLKLKKAKDRIKASGKRCDGNKPYGITTAELQVVKLVKGLTGASSTKGIAEMLNEGGFQTRRNTPWSRSSVEWLQRQFRKEVK